MFTWRGFMIMKGIPPGRKQSTNRRWRSRADQRRPSRQRKRNSPHLQTTSLRRSHRRDKEACKDRLASDLRAFEERDFARGELALLARKVARGRFAIVK